MGFSVPARRYYGQDVSTIVIEHQHDAAQALFAGFCTTFLHHRLVHRFVRFDSEGNHFCLCRAETAGASEVLYTSATPVRLMVWVR